MPAWDDTLLLWDDPTHLWDETQQDSWARHAERYKRTPCMVIEIDLDYIDDGAVTATNPDGSLCYRTPATTDQGTLPVVIKTRRYQTATVRALPELGAIPCVAQVSLGAEEVRIGRGLGFFGQASITLNDFTDNDTRIEDPFAAHASRSGLDLSSGTYLTKLMARNPWWTGRSIRIIEGWATDGRWWPGDTLTHHYQIRDVQGPSDGALRITAAGPLQLLNLGDIEAPAPSEGVLEANITAVATAARIYDPVLADEYPASGYLQIGDETCTFTRSGQDLTLVRGVLDSTAAAHSADDAVQVVLRYLYQTLPDILADLLETYGGVDPDLIDLVGFASEQASWLSLYRLSGTVAKPTKVLDLIQELLEASGSILWWDDQANLIRLRAVRPALTSTATWTDRFSLLSRPVVSRDITQRVSRCDVAIDLRNPSKDPKNASSYRARVIGLPQGEEATQHGKPQVKLIASRWLASDQANLAIRASWTITSQLRDGRQTITVEVSAKEAARQIGDLVTVTSRDIVDRRGVAQPTRCLVTKREAIMAGSRYRYTLERMALNARFIYLCPAGLPDYSSATAAERDPGWFLADTGGVAFGPDDPPYVLG